MKKLFEMTDKQLETILDSCKPVPYMVIGGQAPRTPQQNANSAWASLGNELGFDPMTVEPASGKGEKFFMARGIL